MIQEIGGFGNLSRSELIKYGSRRVTTFLEKVYSGSAFTLTTGEEVTIPTDDENNKASTEALKNFKEKAEDFSSNLRFTVQNKEGRRFSVPLGKFRKTEEFGGGNGGVAGGTVQTNTIEAGQCVVNALFQYSGDITSISGSIENLDLHCRLRKDYPENKVWQELQQLGSDWQTTLVRIGSHLYQNEKVVGSEGGDGYWHWKDSFMDSIKTVYNSYSDKLPGSIERWNPADIWYTSADVSSITNILGDGTGSTCREFTDRMNELYDSKVAVGISLKKLEGEEVSSNAGHVEPKKIKVKDIEVAKDIQPGSSTLNLFVVTSNDIRWNIAITQCNSAPMLRARLMKASGRSHMEGSCTQDIIESCLEKCFNLDEESLSKYQPTSYVEKATVKVAEYILNHPGDFSGDLVAQAEGLLNGNYPTELDESVENHFLAESRSGKEISANKLACVYALKALQELLQPLSDSCVSFVKSLMAYCFSMYYDKEGTSSAKYYKVF